MKPDQLKTFLYICELAVLASATGNHIFVEYSPHVAMVHISIFLNGWKSGAHPDQRFVWYFRDVELCLNQSAFNESNVTMESIVSRLEEIAL